MSDITTLRTALFAQMAELRAVAASGDKEDLKAHLAKAAGVSDLAKTITDTARVEVEYLKAAGGGESAFLNTTVGASNLPPGIKGITRHRLAG